jgi:hypothetical protein
MIRNRYLMILLLMGFFLTCVRVTGYLNNYGVLPNAYGNTEAENVLSSKSFSSRVSVNLLLSAPKSQRILTFRQADLLPFLNSGWISNFDSDAEKIFRAKDKHVLEKTLEEMKIKYLHIPSYYWPSIYSTPMMNYLAEPRFTRPLISLDELWNGDVQESQLFVNERSELRSSCKKFDEMNFYSIGKSISFAENLTSFFSGIPPNKVQKLVNKSERKIQWLDSKSKWSNQVIIGSQNAEYWKISSYASFITIDIHAQSVVGSMNSLKVSSDKGVNWISLMEINPSKSFFRLMGQFRVGDFQRVLISISAKEKFHSDFMINSIQVCEWW